MEPELAYHHSVFNKLAFKVIDFRVSALPLLPRGITLDTFDEHTSVPAAIEDYKSPGSREVFPESPQVMILLFLISRGGDRNDAKHLWIEGGYEASNGSAFTTGIPSLEHQGGGSVAAM